MSVRASSSIIIQIGGHGDVLQVLRRLLLPPRRKPEAGAEHIGRQFISDGYACYAAYGLPPLDKESLLRIFDVAEKDFDKWQVWAGELPGGIDLQDEADDEDIIHRLFWPVVVDGETVRCMGTEDNGMLFLNEKHLGPLSDSPYMAFYERRDAEGKRYIAVKDGLMLTAVIAPMALTTPAVAQDYREFLSRLQRELFKKILPEIYMEEAPILSPEEDGPGGEMEL